MQTLAQNSHVEIKLMDNQKHVAAVILDVKEILSAPLKQSASTMVRVCDQYLPIKVASGDTKGLLRVLMYLEDLGPSKDKPVSVS